MDVNTHSTPTRRRRRRSRSRRKNVTAQDVVQSFKDLKPEEKRPRRRRRTRVKRKKAIVRGLAISFLSLIIGSGVYFWIIRGGSEGHVVDDSVGDVVAVLLPMVLLAVYLVPTIHFGRFFWFKRVARPLRR